jgi:hypothetical protein
MSIARSSILAALAPEPGQPKKVLRQYGLPFSNRWGYSPSQRAPIQAFEDRDVKRLFIEGALSFEHDAQGAYAFLNNQARGPIEQTTDDAEIDVYRIPARPYSFEQLLDHKATGLPPDLVFHVHVPKAGGRTVEALMRLNGFTTLDFDMNRKDFFEIVPQKRLIQQYLAPPPRTRFLLTGHFRLDQLFLRTAWMPHVIITTLRHPIDRMLSHYNHTLRVADNPWHDDVVSEQMTFLQYVENMLAAIGPQYGFFDDTGDGSFARTGHATVETCLDNLVSSVGLFGLTERFEEFLVLIGYFFGESGILAIPPRNVTDRIPNPTGASSKKSLSQAESSELAALLKDDIWFYDEAVKEYERRLADPSIQRLLTTALPLVRSCSGPMEELLAL